MAWGALIAFYTVWFTVAFRALGTGWLPAMIAAAAAGPIGSILDGVFYSGKLRAAVNRVIAERQGAIAVSLLLTGLAFQGGATMVWLYSS